jgi:hypothetical protein
MTKRAAIYCRVSTADQHPETQLYDLREMARQRGYEVIHEYTDVISGAKAKRPGLDQLMADARRRRFDVVLVAAFDRMARSVRHFLEVLDDLNNLGIEFVSHREGYRYRRTIGTSDDRHRRSHRRTRKKSDRRAGPGWNAQGEAGRPPDRPDSAGHRPAAGRA